MRFDNIGADFGTGWMLAILRQAGIGRDKHRLDRFTQYCLELALILVNESKETLFNSAPF
jgi:hypothetical protein